MSTLSEALKNTDLPLQIIVMNLKRRRDRLLAWYGACSSAQPPPESIHVFEAHDGAHYLDSYEIIAAAKKEFPFWQRLEDDHKWIEAEWLGKGSLAVMWSMQSCLKAISEQKRGYYILTCDHFFIRYGIKDFLELFEQVDFDIMQLFHWSEGDYLYPKGFPTSLEKVPDVSYGLAAGDAIFAVTPKGAQRILDWWAEKPFHVLEILFHEKGVEKKELDGCYALTHAEVWIGGQIYLEKYFDVVGSDRLAIDGKEQ